MSESHDATPDEELPGMLAVAKGVAEQRWPHTMDAKKWAEEFVKLNPGADEGLMLSWFANAIMAGYDTARQRSKPSETGTPAIAYEQAIRESIGSILSEHSAKLIMERAADIAGESVAVSAIAAPALPELCKALGWQGGTIHQAVEQTARMRAALQEITRGAGPFNADPLTHADNCIESMKAIATGALEGDWNPE